MKDRNFLAVLVISFTGCLLFFVSFLFPMPALAQGHAGHTMQSPAAVEKQKTAKPPATPEEAPQVEISSEQRQLIGVKTVKVSFKQIQKVIR